MSNQHPQWQEYNAEPSPLPWRLEVDSDSSLGDATPFTRVYGADSRVVMDDYAFYPRAVDPLDMALVVRCVNSHAALLAACKAALRDFDEFINPMLEQLRLHPHTITPGTLRAAISLAEGTEAD